jgi:SNF2 family DNA or RNA helicase
MDTKLILETKSGRRLLVPVTLRFEKHRIWFDQAPIGLKDEIKAMRGSRWHGFDDPPQKVWSVDDCPRNQVQLDYLSGKDVYAWFDQPVKTHEYALPLMPHQAWLADRALTYHYRIWGAEMGVGKTLSAQAVMTLVGTASWLWVGPKSSLTNIEREFRKWGFDIAAAGVEMLSYEQLVKRADEFQPGDSVPLGLIFDESSRLKGPNTRRTRAAQFFADAIREKHGNAGYVILMSGTPSPKTPLDWWSQAEIAWPGFLKEGDVKALERRLAFLVDQQFESGVFKKRVGWRDDASKCAVCGEAEASSVHDGDFSLEDGAHKFQPSKNEVAYLYERLGGLVDRVFKKDCLTLPEKQYRQIICKPNGSTLRLADAIARTALNTITGLSQLRELSDGFLYQPKQDGVVPCPHCPEHTGRVEEWFDPESPDRTFSDRDMLRPEIVSRLEKRSVACPLCHGSGEAPRIVRVTTEVACPKDAVLRDLLDECEETGRIVTFAGFTGSVDRVQRLCIKQGWGVIRCDGRGFEVRDQEGHLVATDRPLDYWADVEANPRVAWVAHPESGGMSFTLVESRMAVFWSNSFKPEYRSQAEDRIHRPGMDENRGCVIVDLLHLPSDEKVLETIRANRRLELMTLGEFVPATAA